MPHRYGQMELRRFYIAPEMAGADHPEITGSDAGHICRVLRLKTGDAVELFDGTGTGYRAHILAATPGRVRLAIDASFPLAAESALQPGAWDPAALDAVRSKVARRAVAIAKALKEGK